MHSPAAHPTSHPGTPHADTPHPGTPHPDFPTPAPWSAERIVRADRAAVWHPYAPRRTEAANYPVRSARGTRITLADAAGTELIDGMSSWWAAAHGHGHPALRAAAHAQIELAPHVMFGGLTHQPAAQLAERLLHWANADLADTADNADLADARSAPATPLSGVFFSDSGSVSVEVALKMALQYQRGCGHPTRDRFLTWRGGYHGDTQGPMSVCDPEGGMHALWSGTLTQQVFAPAPPVWHPTGPLTRATDPTTPTTATTNTPTTPTDPAIAAYLEDLRHLIDDHNATEHGIAAVIVEPVVQGAGGMRFHHPALLTGLRELCTATGTLLILDEIATGFGRTGVDLACHAADILPDILCLGKALTGGMLSFAATLATDAVARAIDHPDGGGALMHGPTFMGNPTAAAIAGAALDLIESGYWRPAVATIDATLRRALAPAATHPLVADVRVLGAIGVIELRDPLTPTEHAAVTAALVDRGVWLRPFGRLLYMMPMFTSTTAELHLLADAAIASLDVLAALRSPDSTARATASAAPANSATSADDATASASAAPVPTCTPRILCVTGTGTGVGKTIATAALARAYSAAGVPVHVIKPVQTGTSDGDDDIRTIAQLSGLPPECLHRGWTYPEALAPTHAAARADLPLPRRAEMHSWLSSIIDTIAHAHADTPTTPDPVILIEGAGGLLVELGEGWGIAELCADLAGIGDASLLIVTPTSLGSLNLAGLTIEAARSRGLRIAGLLGGAHSTTNPDTLNTTLADTTTLAEFAGSQQRWERYGIPWLGALPSGLDAASAADFHRASTQLTLPDLGD